MTYIILAVSVLSTLPAWCSEASAGSQLSETSQVSHLLERVEQQHALMKEQQRRLEEQRRLLNEQREEISLLSLQLTVYRRKKTEIASLQQEFAAVVSSLEGRTFMQDMMCHKMSSCQLQVPAGPA